MAAKTFRQAISGFSKDWKGLAERLPDVEAIVDLAGAHYEIEHQLFFDGITDTEYKQRIRFALLLAADTLGDEVFTTLASNFPTELVMASVVTLQQAVNHEALDTHYAFPCLLNLISHLSITLQPTNTDEGMAQALDLIELGQESRDFILEAYSVVPPTIH